jgi:hypothetical protein
MFGKFRESEIATSQISRELRADIIPLPLWEGESCPTKKPRGESFDTDGKAKPQDCEAP